ncbi:MAG: hypothetical protein ACSHX6_01620 [Akkermansiaceae bacterium]
MSSLSAQAKAKTNADTGTDSVGVLRVSLIFGTDGDVAQAGKGLKKPSVVQMEALHNLKAIKFTHYRLLGEDQQPILRSYENWANPMKSSKEILLSFQPRGQPIDDHLKMDLEFWQSHKKIMKSGATLKKGKPLFIQGPAWRGGKIIISVELMSLTEDKK